MATRQYGRGKPESLETSRYVEWLRDHPVLFCGTIGGIHASIPAKVRARREGYQRGIPDIMVYERAGEFIGLAIEMKARDKYANEEQREWHERLRRRGWQVHVCRSAEEAILATEQYLALQQ